jgi:hypothetical protein
LKIHHHIALLWISVIALAALHVYKFYEGNDDAKAIRAILWKLKKGQDKISQELKYQDSYDDE